MSELDALAHELRTMANKLRRVLLNDGVCYMETLDTLYLSMGDMREAADTIERLSRRLKNAGNVDAERDAMFANALRQIVEQYTDFDLLDVEMSHRQADKLLCDLLLSHGYIETVDEFKSMRKWYA